MPKIKCTNAEILDTKNREAVMNIELRGEDVAPASTGGPTINSRKKRDAARLALRKAKKKNAALSAVEIL